MKWFPITILFLSCLSCRKKAPVYPVKQFQQFQFEKLGNFRPYRMFTKTGEVNNSALVAQYAHEYSQYFYDASSSFSGNQYKIFSFVNEDSLLNTGIVPVGELKRTVISDYDVFTSKYTIPVNDTNAINLHLGKYKVHKLATTPLGYAYFELNEGAAILKKVNDQVYVPIVRYIITSNRDNTFSFVTDRFNNVLDVVGINKLGTSDTLLIQTFDLVLQRKN